MEAFADVARAGKALYIGVSEWTPEQLRAGARWLGNEDLVPSPTSRSTTPSTASSNRRSCPPARSWVSASSASPRSSRASSPASTSRAIQSHKILAPQTLMARNSSRPVDRSGRAEDLIQDWPQREVGLRLVTAAQWMLSAQPTSTPRVGACARSVPSWAFIGARSKLLIFVPRAAHGLTCRCHSSMVVGAILWPTLAT